MAKRIGAAGLMLGLLVACGGGVPVKTGGDGGTAVSAVGGLVIKGPVRGAPVHVFPLTAAFVRGPEMAASMTGEDGSFYAELGAYRGDLVLVTNGGSYTEEALGLPVQVGSNEMTLLLPGWTTGTKATSLRITPVSTLATSLAIWHAQHDGKKLADAWAEATTHLNKHFGDVDWLQVTPADLSVPAADGGVTNLSPEAKAGLVLDGLSWLAKQQAEASNVTPGLVTNGAVLSSLLVQDSSDGTLDGTVDGGVLKSATAALAPSTARADFVQAITGFVNSPRNGSALKLQDITAFLANIGSDADPYLFCPGQVAGPNCGGGPVDTTPPTVRFVAPADGAGVAGSVVIQASGDDDINLASLHFTAPASLASASPVFNTAHTSATLQATLDVSALPDGPVTVRVEAADASGNPAAASITLQVSNTGPKVSISAPSDGTTVKGSIHVSASAAAQAPGATISKFELLSPPPGMGADSLPAADSFAAQWDTTQALEGKVVLTFRATDSFGTSTQATATVTVDNVPFGVVHVAFSAGAPVQGLTAKLLAIDDSTGLPLADGGGVLGVATVLTDADGGVDFTLTAENYSGPVQLVGQGTAASYVDPSDSTTTIALPSSFVFSSYLPAYKTGDALSAPVTYWSTLADAAALAYAQGKNPAKATPSALTAAAAVTDPLFSAHLVTGTAWSVRTTAPVSLTRSAQALRDVVFAAMPDVALNQQARDIALQVGLTPGAGYSAPLLVDALKRDIADGLFDGKASGLALKTPGTTPYAFEADTSRLRMALALDSFIRGAQNKTGLLRTDLQSSAVYDTISGDASILYPAAVPPAHFDNTAPTVTPTITFTNGVLTAASPVGTAGLVGGALTISVDASDPSGMASLTVSVNGTLAVTPTTVPTAQHFAGTFVTTTTFDGPATVKVTACDAVGNCGDTTVAILIDNTAPVVTASKPTAGYFGPSPLSVDVSSTDANGVASLVAEGLDGLVDTDVAPEHLAGAWTPAATVADGPVTFDFKGCDLAGNCTTKPVSGVILDRTAPTVSWSTTPAARVNVSPMTVTLTVTDSGSGVSSVSVQAGAAIVPATKSGSSWVALVPLDTSGAQTTLTAWAVDAAGNSGQGKAAPYIATATVTYDATPPVVTWAPTFVNGTLTSAPVGAAKLVGGALSAVADASDPSGVASISVKVGSSTLTPGMGSTASHFAAAVNTTTVADGALVLTATACDGLGNCGPTPITLTVDNTAPAVAFAKPLGGALFYSQGFDIDATASDANGLASFGLKSPALGSDQDAALAHFYLPASAWAAWPAAWTAGAQVITMGVCDVAGNCAAPTKSVNVDITPPTVTLLTAAPQYTNSSTFTFSVSADDTAAGSGVAAVYAQVSGGPMVLGVKAGANWVFTNFDLTGGHAGTTGVKTVSVSAVDNATPPNTSSSRGGAGVFSTLLDTQAPNIGVLPATSYYDETGMGFSKLASGAPVMPVAYTYASANKVDLGVAGAAINKAASRLSWGPVTPAGADLEGANSRNTPFMQFQVQYAAGGGESPITKIEYSWDYNCSDINYCPDGSYSSAWFTAIPAVATATGQMLVDVPLSSEVVPQLFLTTSARPVLRATDAAGNVATFSPQSGAFRSVNIQAPPVAIVRDTNYTTENDLSSLYAFPVTSSASPYMTLFSNVRKGLLRHSRWLIYNPADVAVSAVLGAGGSGVTLKETWGQYTYVPAISGFYQLDGLSASTTYSWDNLSAGGLQTSTRFRTDCAGSTSQYSPCGNSSNANAAMHLMAIAGGNGSVLFNVACPLVAGGIGYNVGNEVVTQWTSVGNEAFEVFKNPGTAGSEATPADASGVAANAFVVPAASSTTTAGAIVAYGGGLRAFPNRTTWPGAREANPNSGLIQIEFWYADYWSPSATVSGNCYPASQAFLHMADYLSLNSMTRWYKQLSSAVSSTSGATGYTLSVSTSPVDTDVLSGWPKSYTALSHTINVTH